MSFRLPRLVRLGYGVARRLGKVAVALLALALPVQAERVHLLAFGDSLTAGYGLMDHEGFVPQLADWLKARGHDVRIVNAGVSGDTTAGGLARIEWSLSPEMQGMILALGGNDLLRGLDPSVTRGNIAGILDVAERAGLKVLMIGMGAPGNYGPAYKAEFDAIWPDLAAERGVRMVPSFFIGLDGVDPAGMGDLIQPDGIHPSTKGVGLIVEGLGPHVEALIGDIRAGQ